MEFLFAENYVTVFNFFSTQISLKKASVKNCEQIDFFYLTANFMIKKLC